MRIGSAFGKTEIFVILRERRRPRIAELYTDP
jgi:hypothetical protein